MYSIEELIKTFGEHHEKSLKLNEECIARHKEFSPNEPVPEYLTEEFSFPLALQAICKEILHLKTLGNSEGWVHKSVQ